MDHLAARPRPLSCRTCPLKKNGGHLCRMKVVPTHNEVFPQIFQEAMCNRRAPRHEWRQYGLDRRVHGGHVHRLVHVLRHALGGLGEQKSFW